jgi:hypothetical protein
MSHKTSSIFCLNQDKSKNVEGSVSPSKLGQWMAAMQKRSHIHKPLHSNPDFPNTSLNFEFFCSKVLWSQGSFHGGAPFFQLRFAHACFCEQTS